MKGGMVHRASSVTVSPGPPRKIISHGAEQYRLRSMRHQPQHGKSEAQPDAAEEAQVAVKVTSRGR